MTSGSEVGVSSAFASLPRNRYDSLHSAPISTTISAASVLGRVRRGKNRGASPDPRRSGRARGWVSAELVGDGDLAARRSIDDAQRSVDALQPLLAAKSSAESPLARHSRTRSTHFASVSIVMRDNLPPNRPSRKNASSRSGYSERSRST